MAKAGEKPLKIGEIRRLAEELRDVLPETGLPNWTHLSLPARFAVVLQLVPEDRREALGKSSKQLSRYGRGAEIPALVVAALAREAEIPLDFIVSGRPMPRRAPVIYLNSGDPTPSTSDDVPLRRLAFRASAGTGAPALDDTPSFMGF